MLNKIINPLKFSLKNNLFNSITKIKFIKIFSTYNIVNPFEEVIKSKQIKKGNYNVSILDLDANATYTECSDVIDNIYINLKKNIKPTYHELERIEFLITKFPPEKLNGRMYLLLYN